MTKDEAEDAYPVTDEMIQKIEQAGEPVENTPSTPALFLKTLGYVPNIHPTAGDKTSKKYAVGKADKVETGYNYDRGTITGPTFHQRFEPGQTVTREVTRREKRAPILDESTLTHELGHALDPNVNDYWVLRGQNRGGRVMRADPINEGIADGTADRWTYYKGQFNDVLTNLPQRSEDITSSGYSSKYGGWLNNVHRALYVASRYHTALTDQGGGNLPNRTDVFEMLPHEGKLEVNGVSGRWAKRTGNGWDGEREARARDKRHDYMNELYLGHLYDTMPHIRGILKETGFHDTAVKAHEEYKKAMKMTPQGEQLPLPGMEKFI